MVMAEGVAAYTQEWTNDGTGDAVPSSAPAQGSQQAEPGAPAPFHDQLAEGLKKLPDGWRENPAEALVSLITDNEELAFPLS